jgi:energy-coupling factor transporter ATP-binding protein EcfA2
LKVIAEKESEVFQFELPMGEDIWPPSFEEIRNSQIDIDIKLRDTKTGLLREISDLSSGEKTLLALTTLIYTHQSIGKMRRLYLDEIDASLHPTMIESMLYILKKLSSSTQIFLATHSPSTVALVDEDTLFFVEESRARKIEKTEALEGLTQGYITHEGIASVFRAISGNDKTFFVISEGDNYEYLQSMFEKVAISSQCHIHKYKRGRSGGKAVSQLKVLYDLFCDLVESLPKGQKFVFLLDCDQEAKVCGWQKKEKSPIKAFALKKISANPVETGIENVVPQCLIDELKSQHNQSDFSVEKKPSKVVKGKKLVSQKFTDELNSVKSRVDVETLKYTLSDLISLCKNESNPCPT